MSSQMNAKESAISESELEKHLPAWSTLIKKLYEQAKREQELKQESKSG